MFFLSIQSSRLPMTNVCDVKTVYIRRLYDSLFENYQLRNTYRFTQQGIISFGKWAEVLLKSFCVYIDLIEVNIVVTNHSDSLQVLIHSFQSCFPPEVPTCLAVSADRML